MDALEKMMRAKKRSTWRYEDGGDEREEIYLYIYKMVEDKINNEKE